MTSLDVSSPFLVKLRAAGRHIFAGRRMLVAVSGGPDSVALFRGLAELSQEFHCELCAAHVHHGWRGALADADAEFVVALGNELSVPTAVLHISPEQKAAQARKSLEEGARNARYELLIQEAQRTGCSWIAVGHTADDQVETVLHHIVRGTGLSGLSGMPAQRTLADGVCLCRPLLSITRAEVLEYLAHRQQAYCVDATNSDLSLTRNRLRLELLPTLRAQFNPQVDAALLRLSDQARETTAWLESLARELLASTLLDETESGCRLDVRKLADEPELLVRQTLRQLWIQRNWPRQDMDQRDWQRLAALVWQPGAIDLPGGISARRETGPLVIMQR